jgi:hypothetical protein
LSLGSVIAARSTAQTFLVTFYPGGAPSGRTVTLTSSNPGVAAVPASVTMAAGQTAVSVPVTTGQGDGEVTIELRDGTRARALTVFVGVVPPERAPIAVAQPVGVAVLPLQTGGVLVVAPGNRRTLGVQLLTTPAGASTPVSVTSSNPVVAAIGSAAVILQGQRVAALDIVAGEAGEAELTLEFGGERRQLRVVVGTADDRVPGVVAPAVGVVVQP